MLGYVHAEIVEDACAHVPVAHGAAGEDGLIADPDVRAQIAAALEVLARSGARPVEDRR